MKRETRGRSLPSKGKNKSSPQPGTLKISRNKLFWKIHLFLTSLSLSTDWLTDGLTDWLADWLTDSLVCNSHPSNSVSNSVTHRQTRKTHTVTHTRTRRDSLITLKLSSQTTLTSQRSNQSHQEVTDPLGASHPCWTHKSVSPVQWSSEHSVLFEATALNQD